MPSLQVAHVWEQGKSMILIPVDGSFAKKSVDEQRAVLKELEARVHAAGLAGDAAVFWEISGRTHFLGQTRWHSFLSSFSIRAVNASVNRTISW